MSDHLIPGLFSRRIDRRRLIRDASLGGGALALAAGSNWRPAAAKAEQTTVNWWSWNPDQQPAEDFIKTFNVSHPEIKVVYKFNEYDDYLTNLKLGMASGEGPDLLGIQPGAMLKEYGEFLEDLTPYSAKTWGDQWSSRFYDIGLKQLQSGDATPAIPWFISAAGYIWYNKTVFDKQGVQPPTTYDEWVKLCGQLKDKGVTPFLQGAKDPWVNYDMYIAFANEISPGKIYDAEAGNVSWTDPDLVKAMDYWGQLFKNGVMQEGALGEVMYPDDVDKWTKGGAAMILLGTWNDDHLTKTGMDYYHQTLGFSDKFEFLPFPFPDVNGDGKGGRLFGGPDVSLAINNDSDVKDAAWTFIEWCVSEECQKLLAAKLSGPAIKGIAFDDRDVLFPSQKANLKQQEADLANSIGKREFLYPDLKTALADALQNVATGGQKPAAAMAAVDKAFKDIKR